MSNQQKYDEILKSTNKMVCVIAGPGSGKTTGILIPKAQQILSDQNIDPETVLLLSFSRISAEDLKNKVDKKFQDKTPKASTLHSHCLAFLLSEDNHDVRKRVNSIMLDFEKDILVSDLKELSPNLKKNDIKKLLKEFSAAWATQQHDKVFSEPEDKINFKNSIVNWLVEHEALMMEEIVYFAVDLAKKMSDSVFMNKYEYVFIDEYQDLNKLEQEFVDLLAVNTKVLLVVGDPNQSIYSFKYAHPEGIVSFWNRDSVKGFDLEFTGRCAKKIVNIANLILQQINPQRTDLLKPLPNAIDGEVIIKRLDYQEDEFQYVLQKVEEDRKNDTTPKDIIILVPKKKLGEEFVKYANQNKKDVDFEFTLSHKPDFSIQEQEKILLFGLIANPNSLLHLRSFLGLLDKSTHASKEISELKQKYGSYKEILRNAKEEDFNRRKTKVIDICKRIRYLREFIENNTNENEKNIDNIIDELLPETNADLLELRNMITSIKSENDTPKTLYSKFVDYLRTISSKDNQIRVMTILGSKGLDAENVYLIGCNDGNLPGENHSAHLDELSYKQEQKRLLYVGVTRAKKKLVITWCRYIPFKQAKGQHTSTTGTVTKNGKVYNTVGMSEFIQDLPTT